MSAPALANKCILVTRPAGQSDHISRLIRDAGGLPFVFPCIEIRPPDDPALLDRILHDLADFDLAIFVSPTAVACAFGRIAGRGWPQSVRIAAPGQGSAGALRAQGIDGIVAPQGRSDSEALLALPELQAVAGKRIVIFRGEGGRELLAQTLASRGATVEYAVCYRRARPDADITPLLRQHEKQPFSAIILTSRESLDNLRAMLGDAWDAFKTVPVFVPHVRIAEAAREQGLECVQVAENGDAGTMQAMIKFFQS
ncbi:MAG: uroporphyrinogen-III synthase [Pseudomonadota bacterium]